jgi:hypothetical protein
MEQLKVAPVGSVELNVNVAVVEDAGSAGALVIDVSGAAVSIAHVNDAGVRSTFPAVSLPRTWNV